MLKALEDRKLEREKVIRLAEKYFHRISRLISIRAGILYGSYARGDFHAGSDIDLIIIAEDLPEHPLDRWELLYSCISGGMEPKGYTVSEFLKLKGNRNPFILELLSEGVTVFDTGFWGALQKES